MYEVLLPRRVRKGMARFPRKDFDRVLQAIGGLADDPRPPNNAIKMRGTGGQEDWRLRAGDYRAVYRIEEPHPDYPDPEEGEPDGLVTVLAVGHRQGIYG